MSLHRIAELHCDSHLMDVELKRYEDLGIETHRLILGLRNSDRVRLVSFDRNVIELEDHLQWVSRLKEREDVRYFAVFADGTFVGSLSLTAIDFERRTLEFGVAFHEEAGYLPAVVVFELLDRVFLQAEFATITVAATRENVRAVRTNRRLGFREVGTTIRAGREYLEMVMTGSEWRRCREAAHMKPVHILRDELRVLWDGPFASAR